MATRPPLPLPVSLLLALVATSPATSIPRPDRILPSRATHGNAQLERTIADHVARVGAAPGAVTPCAGGTAGPYPCQSIDLAAHLPLSALGAGLANDCWGWTDPRTGREYALLGLSTGTAFVDVTVPVRPLWLGSLPTHTSFSEWRDIKVYANHAYIVSEADNHGMQVFDLRQLRRVATPPVTFVETAHYGGFGYAHNIVINEDTGYAYAVGSDACLGGLVFIDISAPESPVAAGCFSADGYTHDAQVVIYHGPDAAHVGAEIAFAYNEDTITIVDVTNKAAPAQLSRTSYSGFSYTHQGWLTEDQRYLLLDDEGDEENYGHNTLTRIWDVADLESPILIGAYVGTTAAIDHNLYVKGNFAYEANYRAGLQILDLADVGLGQLSQVASFDIYPSSNSAQYNGAWSVYPYFASGTVIVSGIESGLFVLRPNLPAEPAAVLAPATPKGGTDDVEAAVVTLGLPDATVASFQGLGPARPNPFAERTDVEFLLARAQTISMSVHDAAGRRVRALHDGPLAAGAHVLGWDGRDDSGRRLADGIYFVRLERLTGPAETRKVLLLH